MFVSTVLVTLTLAKLALSAPMPTTTSTVVWNENGCLLDSWNRALGAYQFSDDSMTKTKCLAACQERAYTYAGMEAGTQCFCANWVTYGEWSSGAGAPASDCNIPCGGNRTENCGGAFRVWTYKMSTVSVVTPASTSPSATSSSKPSAQTSSSISLSTIKPSSSSVQPAVETVKSVQASSNTGKGGLAWTSESGTDWNSFLDVDQSSIGWTYDWNSVTVPSTPVSRLEFVPMAWGAGSVDGFARDSAKFASLGVRALLSFNEPDQQWENGGANMSPRDAAALHQTIFNSTLSSTYRIGTPSVARGSKWWMEQWLAACDGNCAFDFVPLHYYGIDANDMIAYIKDFIQTFGKPVWVTEYACMDFGGPIIVCDAAQAMTFNKAVLEYMANEPMVERYAAFGTFTSWASGGNANGMMHANGTANALGAFYAGPH